MSCISQAEFESSGWKTAFKYLAQNTNLIKQKNYLNKMKIKIKIFIFIYAKHQNTAGVIFHQLYYGFFSIEPLYTI